MILLTATPISKGVNDAESCIRLLGTENVDPGVIEGIRDLKKELRLEQKKNDRQKSQRLVVIFNHSRFVELAMKSMILVTSFQKNIPLMDED